MNRKYLIYDILCHKVMATDMHKISIIQGYFAVDYSVQPSVEQHTHLIRLKMRIALQVILIMGVPQHLCEEELAFIGADHR